MLLNLMKKKMGFYGAACLALASLSAPSAFADHYGMAGCGLGSMVINDHTMVMQVIGATLNGTSGNQTFGITSGTSNCVPEGAHEQASLFVAVNEEALRKDISRGGGETLTSFSQILQCSDVERLGSTLQRNYGAIFPKAKSDAGQVTKSISESIRADQELAKTCKQVG